MLKGQRAVLERDLIFRLAALRPYYHTYLNALHLKGDGREKVLVPGYRNYKKLEPEVRTQFQQAYPKAEIVFIPSDTLIRQLGAVHCMTCVLPDPAPAARTEKGAALAP